MSIAILVNVRPTVSANTNDEILNLAKCIKWELLEWYYPVKYGHYNCQIGPSLPVVNWVVLQFRIDITVPIAPFTSPASIQRFAINITCAV